MLLHPWPYDQNQDMLRHPHLLQEKLRQNMHAHQFVQALDVEAKYREHLDLHSVFQFLPTIVQWWSLLAVQL